MEDLEAPLARQLRRQDAQRQAEAQVGAVNAVGLHRVGVGDVREGDLLDALAGRLLDQLDQHAFDQPHHILLGDERHLHVELGELRLAVGAQVLIAEAARDLEVAVNARHHQQLLELLRRLGQRVELAREDAAGHEVVARALRRGLGQDRRLDLQEAALVHVVADELDGAVAQLDALAHRVAADVEVAVAQAQLLGGGDVIGDRERDRLGGIEDLDPQRLDLDLAGRQRGILLAGQALAHDALDQQHVLQPGLAGDGVRRGVGLGVEDHLRQAVAVAQVNEDQLAVVAPVGDPARERDLVAHVRGGQLAAGSRAQRRRQARRSGARGAAGCLGGLA